MTNAPLPVSAYDADETVQANRKAACDARDADQANNVSPNGKPDTAPGVSDASGSRPNAGDELRSLDSAQPIGRAVR